jgi:hypothetical protein
MLRWCRCGSGVRANQELIDLRHETNIAFARIGRQLLSQYIFIIGCRSPVTFPPQGPPRPKAGRTFVYSASIEQTDRTTYIGQSGSRVGRQNKVWIETLLAGFSTGICFFQRHPLMKPLKTMISTRSAPLHGSLRPVASPAKDGKSQCHGTNPQFCLPAQPS